MPAVPVARALIAALLGVVTVVAVLSAGYGPAELTVADASDQDGDGVKDVDDACAEAPGLLPDGCPPRDRDGDELLDRTDQCPQTAGPIANRGCPDSDEDGDGVVDRADRCPQARGRKRFDGCPAPDRDGDLVPDPDDQCPDRAEVWNGNRDPDGCPDRGRALVTVRDNRIVVASGRWFSRGARLSARGRDTVAVLATALAAAGTRRIRVEVDVAGARSRGRLTARASRQVAVLRRVLARRLPGVVIEMVPRVASGPARIRIDIL